MGCVVKKSIALAWLEGNSVFVWYRAYVGLDFGARGVGRLLDGMA